MDRIVMQKQISAAILSQDQLVFTYKKDDNIVVRYVTPMELDNDSVLCIQHLPIGGTRKFKLDKILNFHRTITRHDLGNLTPAVPVNSSDDS